MPIRRAQIDHLTIFENYSDNSLKLKCYEALRRRVASHYPKKGGKTLVYLKRGKAGLPRVIENENEIMNALSKNGFRIVDSETESVGELLEILVNAKIVVSMEGSHIAHCIFAVPRDSALLVLQPADRFAANHREWCNCLNVRFGFVVGTAGTAGYVFSTTEIFDTVNLMLASVDG